MPKLLFNLIVRHFKKPIFFYSRPWLLIGLNIILSALILIFYEPFGYKFDSWAEFTQLIGFSIITFFSSILFFLCLPKVPYIKAWMRNWTIGKNCLYSIIFLLVTGLSISFYDFHLIMQYHATDYGSHAFYVCLLTDTIGTFTIGIVPLCIGLMLENSHRLRMHLEEIHHQQEEKKRQPSQRTYQNQSSTVNQSMLKETLAERRATNTVVKEINVKSDPGIKELTIQNPESNAAGTNVQKEQLITLTGETKEQLEIDPEQIVYLEASGNYVNVYFIHEQLERKMLRTTFHNMEEQLADFPFIVRCHRTYMINIHFAIRIIHNEQGYQLLLENCSKEIPISRTYLKELRTIIRP